VRFHCMKKQYIKLFTALFLLCNIHHVHAERDDYYRERFSYETEDDYNRRHRDDIVQAARTRQRDWVEQQVKGRFYGYEIQKIKEVCVTLVTLICSGSDIS
jgi:hypothetical protein